MQPVIVKPREISDVLPNPGMGWTTFYSFDGDEVNEGYPRSTIAYFRFYWDDLEPREGEYRWDIIDELIRIGQSKGQALALRVMAMDGEEGAEFWRQQKTNPNRQIELKKHRVPSWFRQSGCRGADFFDHENWPPGTPTMWEPDYADPIFLEKQGNLIAALGERYDGHPGIDHIDIGTVGRWGEWHCAAVPPPSLEAKRRIIDAYVSAFPKTPLLMLIADQEGLAYAVTRNVGWRADCLGDSRQDFFNPLWEGGTPFWNHMEDVYLQKLVGARALKAWKKSPVAFEACWHMKHWHERGWPAHCTFDYALALHASIFNNKSTPIPEAWREEVNEFSRKMGYRFVLKSLEHPHRGKQGGHLDFSLLWENKGVAPCYRDYALAWRLDNARGCCELTGTTGPDAARRLPGAHVIKESIALPANCPLGSCDLSVALINPATGQPAINLAMKGRGDDGWYRLSTIHVE